MDNLRFPFSAQLFALLSENEDILNSLPVYSIPLVSDKEKFSIIKAKAIAYSD